MRTIVIHHYQTPNTGDRASSPADYFDLGEVETVDARHDDLSWVGSCDVDLIVIGGGSLFGTGQRVEHLLGNCRAPVAIWGAGLDSCRGALRDFPDSLRWAALRGMRDIDAPDWSDWVPCVSCMSPCFDDAPKATRDLVVYDHTSKPVPVNVDAPRAHHEEFRTMQEAVDFLAQGEVVITSTYHGAYWGMLLGRRVAVWPWATKLLHFRHQPHVLGMGDALESALAWAVACPGTLAECREVNEEMYARVRKLTGGV
jgi:hypothetical protein